MAKGHAGGDDRAKVKFRVIEFELEGGNATVESSIRQLAGALSARNAPSQKALPPRQPKELGNGLSAESEEIEETVEDPEVWEAEAPDAQPPRANKGTKSVYKPKLPQYLHDMDITGNGTSFKEFAAAKKPQKNNQRHLVAAFWLKEHGGSPTVNMDKAYTCYRTADWPTSMPDWDVNFRSQLKNNRFRRVGAGEYAITPKGEDDVRKMDGTE